MTRIQSEIGASRIIRISAGEISIFYFWSLDRSLEFEETHGSPIHDYDMIAPQNNGRILL